MKINLTELLKKVGNEADLEEVDKVSFPADGLSLIRPIKLSLHLVNTGASVLLMGRVETEAEMECSRCLKNFELPLAIDLEEEFTKSPPVPKRKKEIELEPEDFASSINEDNTIDLTELVRQNLLLALPIKVLCSPDCRGIEEN
jgi:uncharacterized protein